MIILTGGAGFIGSNLLAALNAKGVTDVLSSIAAAITFATFAI